MSARISVWLRPAFGLALLGALLAWADLPAVLAPLVRLDGAWVAVAAGFIVAATLLSGANLYLLVNLEGRLRFFAFLPLYWISWAVALVVPGQVGDIASIGALLKRRGVDWHESVGRSLVDKVVSLGCSLAVGLAGLAVIAERWGWSGGGAAAIATGIAVAALAAWLAGERLARWADPAAPGARGFLGRAGREFGAVLRHRPRRVLVNAAITLGRIALTGGAYWAMFQAVGYTDPGFWKVVPLVAVTSVVAYLPVSFNGIGTVEAAGVVLFRTLGMDEAGILAAYLALRALVMLLAWVPGGAALLLFRRAGG